MTAARLLVVGGDAAGMSAAATARRRTSPDELEIVAFERGEHTSYAACGLPYFVADAGIALDDLVARTPDEHRRRGIDVRTRTEVVAIDLQRRAVLARDLTDGTDRWEPFDRLVVATGAVPLRPPLPGADAPGVFGIQTLDDGLALRRFIDERRPEHAVVVGGGYIGLEMAEAMVRRGIAVTLVESGDHPMAALDPDMGGLVADALRGIGVTLRLGERVEAFESGPGGLAAVASEHGPIPADLVVLGLGVRPNARLAREAGIPTGPTGGIATDRRMATRVEGVYAAGDCVETRHRVTGRPTAIALGTHANKQGRVAGINVSGGYASFPGVIGTAVTKVCEYEVARTGLGEHDARLAGFEPVVGRIESSTRAHYMEGAPITVKLVCDRADGRVLGGQIIGEEGAAKRIDVLATAVWCEMTAEQVMSLDLSYAPPFSPVWDPVQVAARQVVSRLGDD